MKMGLNYDVDDIKAIAEIIDIQVKFKFAHWDPILGDLKRGKVDVIASIVYSERREKSFDFTLHAEYYSIFAKKQTLIMEALLSLMFLATTPLKQELGRIHIH